MRSSRTPNRLEPFLWIAAGLLALVFGVASCGSGEGGKTPAPPTGEAAEAADVDEAAWEQEFAEALQALESSDPDERSLALFDLDPEGPGLEVLLEVLSDDPDPEVRGLAARQLGYAESPEATAGLIAALDDPAPQVVIEAIDALQMIEGTSALGALEKLRQHPDAEVRDAAEDGIEYLSD